MGETFGSRIKHAWNVFMNKDPTSYRTDYGAGYYYRPDRARIRFYTDKSLVTPIINRIALDAAAIDIKHVRLDENERYFETIDSSLNYCLTTEANLDQTSRAFLLDAILSMLDEGCVALVPVQTSANIFKENVFEIGTIRTAKILEWYPKFVKVSLYNEDTGQKQDVVVPKKSVAIIENPFYAVMNSPNSTLQRLIRKLTLLDAIDDQSGSGKLDLIIQLPYVVKGEFKRQQAEERRKQIENQLEGSKFGIAYIDGTERVTQLNRPVENTLMSQIEYLTNMLYSQLGLTQAIMDGTANADVMQNYYTRTIEPIVAALADEMRRKFLTKTARTKGQTVMYFRDPFSLVPVSAIAEIADKMTRNEIMSSNEIRQIVGMKPSDQPGADELRNKNLNQSKEAIGENAVNEQIQNEGSESDA